MKHINSRFIAFVGLLAAIMYVGVLIEYPSISRVPAGMAIAQTMPSPASISPPVDPVGRVSGCSGTIVLAAGTGNSVLTAASNTANGTNLAGSCLSNFKNIACVPIVVNNVGAAPATPANTPAMFSCFASPTATATAGMAATATQTAVFGEASTANSTATLLWWGAN